MSPPPPSGARHNGTDSAPAEAPELNVVAMTAGAARAIDRWHYPGIYGFYDLDRDAEDREEFLSPANWGDRVYAVVAECHDVIGFFSFDREGDTIALGLGLHPEYTGRGLGRAFVQTGLDFANRVFQPTTFRLSVATFNRRAIRVYERLGFTAQKVFLQQTNGGEYEFVQMSRPARGGPGEASP